MHDHRTRTVDLNASAAAIEVLPRGSLHRSRHANINKGCPAHVDRSEEIEGGTEPGSVRTLP